MTILHKQVDYGFQYGPATITRLCSDSRKGWVVLLLETPKQSIQIYVTRTGKIRINDPSGEWFRMENG